MPGRMSPSSALSTSASGTSTIAPMTGPHRLPTPPNNARISGWAETSMPNTVSGVTTRRTTAYNPPAMAASAPLSMIARIFQSHVSMPAASAAGSFCLIASSDMPKREFSTRREISMAAISRISASPTIGSGICELHVKDRRITLHRQGHLLVPQPLKDVERRQRISEHGEREVMPAQPERRIADERRGDDAHHRAQRDADPWGQVEIKHAERYRVGAETPEGGMSKGEITAVAAENVPGERQHRPQQDLSQNQLVIGACYEERHRHDREGEARNRPELMFGRSAGSHVRSLSRPNIPCGRRKMISRKTTKIAVFCS